jgi:hypothetical protein
LKVRNCRLRARINDLITAYLAPLQLNVGAIWEDAAQSLTAGTVKHAWFSTVHLPLPLARALLLNTPVQSRLLLQLQANNSGIRQTPTRVIGPRLYPILRIRVGMAGWHGENKTGSAA